MNQPERKCLVCGRRVGGPETRYAATRQRRYCSRAHAWMALRRRRIGRPEATLLPVVVLNLATRKLEWVWCSSDGQPREFPLHHHGGVALNPLGVGWSAGDDYYRTPMSAIDPQELARWRYGEAPAVVARSRHS
jgi:hypothetical protein